MITVRVQGGLGNQLFQYAYGRALTALGKDVVYDISFYVSKENGVYTKRKYLLDKFVLADTIKTTETFAPQKLFTKILNKIDFDRRIRYVPVSPSIDNVVVDGYFVSEEYFRSIRKDILVEISIKDKSPLYEEWRKRIKDTPKSLIVHARRTDYVGSGFVNLDARYYSEALKQFDPDCTVFAFSDDIEWLKKTLNKDVVAVSGQGLTDYEEMMLMSEGKNFIIANSTFSWWGAWLAQYEGKKVVTPKQWFSSPWYFRTEKTINPKEWIRL